MPQQTTDTDFAAFLGAIKSVKTTAISTMPSKRTQGKTDWLFTLDCTPDELQQFRKEFDGPIWCVKFITMETSTIPWMFRLRKSLIRAAVGETHAANTLAMFPWLAEIIRD